MILKASIVTAILFVGFAASAHTPVEKMTCARAQAYVRKHSSYWKDAGSDGEIPIYPVYTRETINCSGKTMVAPQMESTLDESDCVVGWYCLSY